MSDLQPQTSDPMVRKVVVVTGAARRIGAAIVRYLHEMGFNVVIHYRSNPELARQLAAELEANRANSTLLITGDLADFNEFYGYIDKINDKWGRLDILVNNASSFFPTPIGQVDGDEWDDLMASNMKGPFFLSQAAVGLLRASQGCIVNITDLHGSRPLKDYPVYSMAKAGLSMMTQALAKELAPVIRVNAVAPGTILWPEGENRLDESQKEKILGKTLLKVDDRSLAIAKAVYYLAAEAPFTTGHTLSVDGGRF